MTFTEYVPITDVSSVGEARRRGLLAAERLGFDEVRCGEFALLTTEVSRNILTHAGRGETVIAGARNARGQTAGILALDKGPGIPNISQAMSDGYSTAGTMGAGMGAMRRLASTLEVFTGRSGTIVFLEVAEAEKERGLKVAGMAVPYPGERYCGDAWTCHQTDDRTQLIIVDGLGHGADAALAAAEAIDTFRKRIQCSPAEILSYLHDALKKTRGAVAAVAEICPGQKTIKYAGAGNISAVVLSCGKSRSLVSHNGTLGVAVPRIQEFRTEWPDDGILVMHSDGLHSRWDLSGYSGLLARHPAIIGGALLRDFRRERDDASVVVAKAAA